MYSSGDKPSDFTIWSNEVGVAVKDSGWALPHVGLPGLLDFIRGAYVAPARKNVGCIAYEGEYFT